MGTPAYSTAILARKYKEACLDCMRNLKAKGYTIYYSYEGTCDPTNMTIRISPSDSDPLQTLTEYWKQSEDKYKQDSFIDAFHEFEKEGK